MLQSDSPELSQSHSQKVMAQPVKKEIKKVHKIKKTKKSTSQGKRKHKEYGTSKLEEKFAKEFLEKLGVKYIYQYKYTRVSSAHSIDFSLIYNSIFIILYIIQRL